MRCTLAAVVLVAVAFSLLTKADAAEGQVSGELRKWHKITITFEGPNASEREPANPFAPNPFADFRLDVTFRKGDKSYLVPGYYAADGNAAESGADSGNKWRVHFRPDDEGEWTYTVSFLSGRGVAADLQTRALPRPTAFHGATGTFTIGPSDKKAPDLRGRGTLRYIGKHHLQFAETGEYFLKGGADSPENFLGYADFDGTRQPDTKQARHGEALSGGLHRYGPHLRDWRTGDPTWRDGRGKGIIGALNYLGSKGVNSVYFLTMNVGGDGRDVWPWVEPDVRDRFDCSRLDQWEIVFDHMDRLGIMLHVVTQEQENDQLLDGGELGPERRLYYRELIARFGHHPAITWNLGEENTNTTEQQKEFSTYIDRLDPYDHPVVVHTFPNKYDEVYNPLLGHNHLHGPSLQTNQTHRQTIRWLDRSREAGHPWVICLDEIGPAHTGVKPDADDPDHDEVRQKHLWGNLMAGGGGVEWYFGYRFAHNDLNLEDFRSRANLWDQTRYAREFFERHLPFHEMRHADNLTSNPDDYCLAKPGEVYAIYIPNGGTTELDLGGASGTFEVLWYNPRAGGELQRGRVERVQAGSRQSVGEPPSDPEADWAVLVRRTGGSH